MNNPFKRPAGDDHWDKLATSLFGIPAMDVDDLELPDPDRPVQPVAVEPVTPELASPHTVGDVPAAGKREDDRPASFGDDLEIESENSDSEQVDAELAARPLTVAEEQDDYWKALDQFSWDEVEGKKARSAPPETQGESASSQGDQPIPESRSGRGSRDRDRGRSPRRDDGDRPRRSERGSEPRGSRSESPSSRNAESRPRREQSVVEDRPRAAARESVQVAGEASSGDDFGLGLVETPSAPRHRERSERERAGSSGRSPRNRPDRNREPKVSDEFAEELLEDRLDDEDDIEPTVATRDDLDDDGFGAGLVSGSSTQDGDTADGASEDERPPRRRRRRRRSRGDRSDEGRAEHITSSDSEDSEEPFGSELSDSSHRDQDSADGAGFGDSGSSADEQDDREDEDRPRRRRRRRGRGRGRTEESVSGTESSRAPESRDFGEDDHPHEASDGEREDEESPVAQPVTTGYANIPSWEEAISLLVQPQMVNRPHRQRHGSDDRGRHRRPNR